MRLFGFRLSVLASATLMASAMACGMSSVGADSATGGAGDYSNGAVDAGPDKSFTPAPADGGVGGANQVQGSLLCNHNGATCDPDVEANGGGCGSPSVGSDDAGAYVVDASTLACRVAKTPATAGSDDLTSPTCSAAGAGENGAACQSSSDCAAGFECVGNNGVCRHYCCDDVCKADSFCDIQPATGASGLKVPVCVPVHACSLLSGAGCGPDETCTIVNDNDGTTSCVATGPAKVGESCDTVHCGENLVCLGELNARKCFALCSKSASTCTAPETCQGSAPLFHDMDIGVCQ